MQCCQYLCDFLILHLVEFSESRRVRGWWLDWSTMLTDTLLHCLSYGGITELCVICWLHVFLSFFATSFSCRLMIVVRHAQCARGLLSFYRECDTQSQSVWVRTLGVVVELRFETIGHLWYALCEILHGPFHGLV